MASILKVTEITTPDGTGNITVSRPLSSVQLGGVLDVNGNYVQTEKGGDIASASPLVIDTDGDYFDVTGTTGFAAMTVAADRQFTLQFDGALVMTHHATNLDLPGEANITTAAGDVATFQSTGSNTVQCINYTKADGTATVAPAGLGTIPVIILTKNGNQTVTTATKEDIVTWTEVVDSESSFASDLWTPQTAGNYFLTVTGTLTDLDDGKTLEINIEKNGTPLPNGGRQTHTGHANAVTMTATTCIALNGSTDNVGFTVTHGHGSDRTLSASGTMASGFKIAE